MALHSTSVADKLQTELSEVGLKLLSYCRDNDWAGYDPYDGLDTPLLTLPPLRNSRHLRILVTQLLKRSPINLRPVMRIQKSRNPKALALFLAANVQLSRLGLLTSQCAVTELVDLLQISRSANPNCSWGYTFPWQTRTQLVPKGQANLVCTVFAASALLDAYDLLGDQRCLEMAKGASKFIANELYWTDGDGRASLAYPLPTSRSPVHNANLLGAAFLCRLHRFSKSPDLLDRGLRLARHAAALQRPDGSWSYGEAPHWRWVDNFHTGFNLCALHSISVHAASSEFDSTLVRGLDFYRQNFFLDSGAPRYRSDRTYPIDIHSVAQAIITMATLKDLHPDNLGLAVSVYRWSAKNMLGPRGHFDYQVWPWYTNRIPYMRWSQAWMLLAITTLLSTTAHEDSIRLQARLAA
jgi:hypothetical protein